MDPKLKPAAAVDTPKTGCAEKNGGGVEPAEVNENAEPDDEPNVNELPGADVDSPNENPVDGDALDPKLVPKTDDADG